jgi:hypothetical protein
MPSNTSAQGGNSDIKKLEITSNYDGSVVDFSTGTAELSIYESLMDNTVRANAAFVDSGYGEMGGAVTESARKGFFNKSAGEKTELIVEDGYKQKLLFTGDYQLRTKRSTREAFGGNTTSTSLITDFYSKESMLNHLVENRVTQKYEGKINDTVGEILEKVLKTEKDFVSDNVLNEYTLIGGSQKVFHVCTSLGKYAVPDGFNGSYGKLAGFLFYEIAFDGTEGGYRFRSIDKLFSQEPKRKLIDNSTTLLPDGYDYKILKHYENVNIDIEDQLISGALFQRELRTFEPLNKVFDQNDFNYLEQELVDNNAGVEFYKLASDLDLQKKSSRFSTKFWDTGVLPKGRNWEEQQEGSKIPQFDIDSIIRQSSNRVNQMFTSQLNILIPMDLGIHAGDILQCDFPEITSNITKRTSDIKSGKYLIMDICHRINKTGSFSSVHLVRDTIYKK